MSQPKGTSVLRGRKDVRNIGKTAGGVILHDSASKAACVQKVTGRQRFKHKLLSAFSLGG